MDEFVLVNETLLKLGGCLDSGGCRNSLAASLAHFFFIGLHSSGEGLFLDNKVMFADGWTKGVALRSEKHCKIAKIVLDLSETTDTSEVVEELSALMVRIDGQHCISEDDRDALLRIDVILKMLKLCSY